MKINGTVHGDAPLGDAPLGDAPLGDAPLEHGKRARRARRPGVVWPGVVWMLCCASTVVLAQDQHPSGASGVPAASAAPAASAPAAELSLETILERMAQARAENRTRFRPFVVTRGYRMFSGLAAGVASAAPGAAPSAAPSAATGAAPGAASGVASSIAPGGAPTVTTKQVKPRSEVSVTVSFTPPDRKTFVIGESSGGIGERTVRRILQSESESAKDYTKSDYSHVNYSFRLLAQDQMLNGARCFLLEMTPKRAERTLLRGKIWVDAETYLVHRFEGSPAKSSSWWIKGEQIVLLYSDVAGMWLQTGTEGTAQVRVIGPHRLISRDEKYEFPGAEPFFLPPPVVPLAIPAATTARR